MAETLTLEAGGLDWRLDAAGSSESPPLILLHGFGADGRVWAPLMATLKADWRVIAVDLPGHGGTSAPPADWDLPRAAQALATLLPPNPTVLGYSLGGRLALHLALEVDLAGLVLVGASPGLADPAARASRIAADAAWIAKLNVGMDEFLPAWEAQPLFATRVLDSRARAIRHSQHPPGLAAALVAFGTGRQAPLHARLADMQVPTVCVVGERDEKFKGIADQLVTQMPHATCLVAAGAGHDVPTERPETLFTALSRLTQPEGNRR